MGHAARLPRRPRVCYNFYMSKLISVLTFTALTASISLAQAQHVIVLKNGRQIAVQSYREEGSMIKFVGLGGEIGIPKDHIQAIVKSGKIDRTGLSLPELEKGSRQTGSAPVKPVSAPPRDPTETPGSAEAKPSVDIEEVTEYQKRFADITERLEVAKEKYFNATQGGGTSSNLSKEGIRAWTMDFASRIHDSQKVPGGGGPSSSPPTPPYLPNYTAKEKELSDLRIQIDSLQKERNALIEEMKSKNIPTSSL
jgi:hypothetical protein